MSDAEQEPQRVDPIFIQRVRMDVRWGATQIDSLRRMLDLVVKQVDMPANDDRTLMIFRRGTCIAQARELLNYLDQQAGFK